MNRSEYGTHFPSQTGSTGQAILEAIHLRKEFPRRSRSPFAPTTVIHAVQDASLELYPGRATALVGESGSGKTTVARMLARMYDPTAGRIRYHQADLSFKKGTDLQDYRRHVQYIFQDPFSSLNPVHTVRYHLSRPLRAYGYVHTDQQEIEQIEALLNRVSLTPARQFLEKFPHQLSGGQLQRVSIARALAVRPEVLLADEPVSMLDVSIRLDILNLLLRLKEEEKLAFLYITHDIASARYFAEETRVMYAGQLVEGGPSEAIIAQPHHPYTRLLISTAPDPDRPRMRRGIASQPAIGEIPSLVTPPTGCRFHPRCPHAMAVCGERFPERTDLGNGHWTNCFLYSKNLSAEARRPPNAILEKQHH